MAKKRNRKYTIYDAFETKRGAISSANDLRAAGETASVRKITPQDSGRLKWGIFSAGRRKR